ncbi:MFS transporter [Sclerotinia borealis F-4128]|uniref:MFS transporter n=1 Tax=Sclerotinia borealis (strain F-4128) TaxID=1432307 RepID=W9C5R7_SCLBF|nr:MFS transporter [Sclerotinia borealis F-4128]
MTRLLESSLLADKMLEASAKNAAILLSVRIIQAVGGGGREALCEITSTDLTLSIERLICIGILGMTWADGSILAPMVGVLFIQYVCWRWIAWVNLPLMRITL